MADSDFKGLNELVVLSDDDVIAVQQDTTDETFFVKVSNLGGDFIPVSEKAAPLGVATLGADSRIPSSQLPTSAVEYHGAWNADTNVPLLVDGTGVNGSEYRISVAGTIDLGSGSETYAIGDVVIYNGTIWEKIPADDQVSSVNALVGAVVIDFDNIVTNTTGLTTTKAQLESLSTVEIVNDQHQHFRETVWHFKDALKAKTGTYEDMAFVIGIGNDNRPAPINVKFLAIVNVTSGTGSIKIVNRDDSDAIITEFTGITNTDPEIIELTVDPNDVPDVQSLFAIQGLNAGGGETRLQLVHRLENQ